MWIFYSALVEYMSDDVVGETLVFDEEYLVNLFGRTFGPGYQDNFQKSLVWLCYRSVLPVGERLSWY